MSQIHLFIGPNTYALNEERLRWVRGFREKHGAENLIVIDGKDLTVNEIINQISSAPFLAEKRLVIAEGLPKGKKGDGATLMGAIHPSVVLLFAVESDIGKKAKPTVFEKELRLVAQVRECPVLTTAKLQQWMDAYVASAGSSFKPDARKNLLDDVGEQQELLAQEMTKLTIFAAGRPIEAADVRVLVACSAEREAWQLMEVLGTSGATAALRCARNLLDRGLSPQALWSSLLWIIAQMIQVRAFVEAGERDPWAIARILHANGYGIKSVLPWAQRTNAEQLRLIVHRTVSADRGLKTGEYKASADAQEEQLALIDHVILSFAEAR